MTNISQTFNNSQIGAVAGSGDISADAISAVSGMQSSAHKEILLEVLALVSQINDSGLKSQGQSAVADAAKHPKKPVWERLVSFLNALKIGASATAGSIEGVDKLIDSIGQLQLPG